LELVRAAFIAVCLFSVSGCSPGAEEQECWELLDLYTEKVIDQARPKTDARERAKLKALSRERAQQDPEFLDCPKRVSRTQVDCARKSVTADEIERCLL